MADTSASNLKENTGMTSKRFILLMKFVAVPDTNNLVVNIELTKIKIINVVINLRWHNADYPCYLVGRLHSTFTVTTIRYIP